MQVKRCYFSLLPENYNDGEYTIPFTDVVENPVRVVIQNICIESPNDSKFIHVKSRELSKNKREKVAQQNNKSSNVVYTIYPENRISRSITTTVNNTSKLGDVLAHVSNGWVQMWLDFAVVGNVINYSDENASPGETVKEFKGRHPGANTIRFYPNQANAVTYVNLGQGKGVTGSNSVNWEAATDSPSADNPFDLDRGSHLFLLRSPPVASTFEVIWESSSLHLFYYNNLIQVKDTSNSYMSTGLSFLAATDYLLEIQYTPTSSSAKLIKLSDNTEAVSGSLAAIRSHNSTKNKAVSTAQTGFQGTFGDYIHCKPSAVSDCIQYMKEVYNGEAGTSTSTSTAYQMFGKGQRAYPMQQTSTSLRELDISFEDQNGAFNPHSGHVELSFSYQ